MTAPISNGPTTTRLHHYAGHYLGYEHADRLITYPDAPFLSGCAVPIRMRRSYPDTRFLSRCAVPIRMRRSYPDTRFLSGYAVPIQMRRSYPDAPFLSRCVVPIQMRGHESTNRQAHAVSHADNQLASHLLTDPTHRTLSRG